jgi:formate dehydrogenase iron-sulfur subunit
MKTIRCYLANDTSSRAAGAGRLADAWSGRPEIQLIRTSSRGAFFLEPMVERDTPNGREAWFNVAPDDLPRIVGGMGGTPVARIPFLQQQTRFTFANFGITEPLALDEYQTRGGLRGLEAAQSLSPEAIVEELRISRLRGRGGAAFPVWKKWQVAQQIGSEQKYVVANADEGDAGTYCDRMIMEGDPFRLIEGMMICARAIGATRGYIYCRYEYPAAARALRFAIQKAREADLLDCDDYPFDLEVVTGAGSYVCGEETALLESLEGRRGVVLAKPPYPAESGLYGKPTIVSNVLTFATIPNILANGGAWHASLGTEGSRGTMALQLGGRVKQPGLVEIPLVSRCAGCWINLVVAWHRARGSKPCRSGGRWGACFLNRNSISPSAMTRSPRPEPFSGMGASLSTMMRRTWSSWRGTSWPSRRTNPAASAHPAGLGRCAGAKFLSVSKRREGPLNHWIS